MSSLWGQLNGSPKCPIAERFFIMVISKIYSQLL
jgi:hypothetical protein